MNYEASLILENQDKRPSAFIAGRPTPFFSEEVSVVGGAFTPPTTSLLLFSGGEGNFASHRKVRDDSYLPIISCMNMHMLASRFFARASQADGMYSHNCHQWQVCPRSMEEASLCHARVVRQSEFLKNYLPWIS